MMVFSHENERHGTADSGDDSTTTEGGAMSIMTESQPSTTQQLPLLLRLLPASEPINAEATPLPPPESRPAFAPGSWERLVVAAGLDRESRELSA
jgi:hypothetical protein